MSLQINYDYMSAEGEGTQRLNQLVDYVCSVNGWDFGQLADALGVYRPAFGRMRKGGLGKWGWIEVKNLIKLAAAIDEPQIYDWLLNEVDEG